MRMILHLVALPGMGIALLDRVRKRVSLQFAPGSPQQSRSPRHTPQQLERGLSIAVEPIDQNLQ